MALDGCGTACKYIIILFNVIFALVGVAMLGVGLWLRLGNDTRDFFEIQELNKNAFVMGVTVLIVLGSVMLVVISFGDYGACNENRCALQVFCALLAVMAVAEIAAGVLAYSKSDEVGRQLAEFYTYMYGLYVAKGDPAGFVTLTLFHNVFNCCGVVGVFDASSVKKICPKPEGFWAKLTMPPCPGVIASVFDTKAPLVLGFFVGLGALLFFVMLCSAILKKKILLSHSSSHYIILSSAPAPATLYPYPQHNIPITSSHPYPDQDPVVFTPITYHPPEIQ